MIVQAPLLAAAAYILYKERNNLSKRLGELSYLFTPEHRTVQERIDRILGSGFITTGNIPATQLYFLYNGNYNGRIGWHPINWGMVQALLNENPNWRQKSNLWTSIFVPCGPTSYNSNSGWKPVTMEEIRYLLFLNPDWVNQSLVHLGIYTFGNGNFKALKPEKGWKDVNWMHWESAEKAAEGIFNEVTQGDSYPNVNPGDSWRAYNYPSPAIVNAYGNNLNYYVRCGPEEITCQFFIYEENFDNSNRFISGYRFGGALWNESFKCFISAIESKGFTWGKRVKEKRV